MLVEKQVPLQPYNTFGIAARAQQLARIRSEADVRALMTAPDWAITPRFVLGGGSNLVITGDIKALVLKVEVEGRRLVEETDKGWLVEAGGGENWHGFVAWALDQGWPGLENMALIPGTVGASPVQNIGAYGVELQDRFHSLDAVELDTVRVTAEAIARQALGTSVITVEDIAELRLQTEHVLRFESRPATYDGTLEVSLSTLLRSALRMRPNRFVLGEVRSDEALDMLTAMNTGHHGSLATCHANSPDDALRRIESMVLQAAPQWPLPAVREHLRAAVDIIVHVERSPNGHRRVSEITEVSMRPDVLGTKTLWTQGAATARLSRGRG